MASLETEITGVLLAEGKAAGWASNKPLLEKDGRAMFRQISTPTVRTLAWLISANRDLDLYETAGWSCRPRKLRPKWHRDRHDSSGNSVALRFSRRYPS